MPDTADHAWLPGCSGRERPVVVVINPGRVVPVVPGVPKSVSPRSLVIDDSLVISDTNDQELEDDSGDDEPPPKHVWLRLAAWDS